MSKKHKVIEQPEDTVAIDTVPAPENQEGVILHTKTGVIKPRNDSQKKFIETVKNNDVVFAIGPAGTGKTYVATALAVAELKARTKKKLILSRPVVEAGEKLGFLPGDINDKLDPYIRPLYDALDEMIRVDILNKNVERRIIEIAPVAFLRGRTLGPDWFVICDEAQNLTLSQLKLLLTRLGKNSKMIITGDITQCDILKGTSGLIEIQRVFRKPIKNIAFHYFDSRDVVRSEMVKSVVKAFEEYEKK